MKRTTAILSIITACLTTLLLAPLAAQAQQPSPSASSPMIKWADSSRLGRPLSKDPNVIEFGGRYLVYFSLPPFDPKLAPGNAPAGWSIGIAESVGTDRDRTWPELKPSSILHTPSRFFIRRLASGNLLLVKHGPLDTRTSRSHLTACLSKDDGHTWTGGLMLDERPGVSYPDGQQTPDGLIRIIYDYNRVSDRNILMATFREEDVAAGKDVSGAVKLRQLVNKATGGQERPKPFTARVHANADGKPMRTTQPGTLIIADIKPQPFVSGAKLFSDRTYIAAEVPAALKNAHCDFFHDGIANELDT